MFGAKRKARVVRAPRPGNIPLVTASVADNPQPSGALAPGYLHAIYIKRISRGAAEFGPAFASVPVFSKGSNFAVSNPVSAPELVWDRFTLPQIGPNNTLLPYPTTGALIENPYRDADFS